MGFAMMMMVGSGLSAAGQIAGGAAARRAGRVNKENMFEQAEQVETQTGAEVGALRRQLDRFRGALRGDMAAFGGSAKRGTGLMLAQQAERDAKLDELNIITEGTNQAQALRSGGAMAQYEGEVKQRNAVFGGLGTALQGFGRYKQMTA